jgi:hypothetical protein
MDEGDAGVRLRQAVLVARDLEPVAQALRDGLGLGEPFRDPGVGEFGLANVVFAIGDCFLEVVSPLAEGTAASRQLERAGGDGGYMALFDLRDLDGARRRLAALGVRVVWQIDLPDIAGTHLHPADMPGTIVSLDRSEPYGTWRWGGPQWTGQTGRGAAGRLRGITVAVRDPLAASARWGEVLGVEPRPVEGSALQLALDGGEVRLTSTPPGAVEQITTISIQLPADVRAGREVLEIGSARLELSDLP